MSVSSPEGGAESETGADEPLFYGEDVPPGLPVYSAEVEIPIHLQNRPKIDIPDQLQKIQEAVDFRPGHGRWQIAYDAIGLIRRGRNGEKDETYKEKLSTEEERGKTESATFGLAKFGDQDAVLYAMNWEFFVGSLGVVAGEKFQAAADMARRRHLPLVSIYASGGVRQQENFAGLLQMTRMTEAIRKYKENVKCPHVAVLLGNVWGGVSASAVVNGDIVIATRGTNYGFAGPRVIEAFEHSSVPKGAQSAETNMIDRNIDAVVPDIEGLVTYIGDFLSASHLPDKEHALGKTGAPTLNVIHAPGQSRIMEFGAQGIASPTVRPLDSEAQHITVKPRRIKPDLDEEDKLVDQFHGLITDANRVDLDFLLRNAFEHAVPFYNAIQEDDIKRYPAVVGAVACLGKQPLLVIGSQPSYRRAGETAIKQPASPGPEDFEYAVRILEMGNRLGLPALFITDTLGALPTLESEKRGQSRAIGHLIMKGIGYKHPVISLITGILGSGGGLATTPFGDHVMMMEKAMSFVAEPRSAASILYDQPTDEEIKTTINTIRATAQDQLDLRLIDEVIPEGQSLYDDALTIREAVARSLIQLYATRRLHHKRENRIRAASLPIHKEE